jgi:hypothetical protein
MRGGWLHNEVLVARLEKQFQKLGIRAVREFPVRVGTRHGFVDLYVEGTGWKLACEAETSPRRIPWDISKAEAICAPLAVITPTYDVAQACRNLIRRERGHGPGKLPVFVLTVGAVDQWFSNCFRLISMPNQGSKIN